MFLANFKFVEYATVEKAQSVIATKNWKMAGRPAYVMQAGTKPKGQENKGSNNANSSEKDKRTLFVKGKEFIFVFTLKK